MHWVDSSLFYIRMTSKFQASCTAEFASEILLYDVPCEYSYFLHPRYLVGTRMKDLLVQSGKTLDQCVTALQNFV